MATKHIHEIIAKLTGFGKAQKGVKQLSSSMKKFAGGLLGAAAAYKTFSAGFDSIKLAGKLEGVERGFNNMRKSAGFSINTFSKLDKALNGTADRMTIMTQANNAMLLGITDSEDQMAEMFDVAQRLALAVGQDAAFGIESLVTGLGRQSKLMLDNLGIMVDTDDAYKNYAKELGKTADKLTDQERKQAFVNAAMEEATTLVKGLGKENLTTKQKLDKFTTSISNFKAEVGEALIESGVLDELTKYSKVLINLAKNTFNLGTEEEKLAQKTERLKKEIQEEKELLENLTYVSQQMTLADQYRAEGQKNLWNIITGKNKAMEEETLSEEEALKKKEALLVVEKMMELSGKGYAATLKEVNDELKRSEEWLELTEGQLESHLEKQQKKIELDNEEAQSTRRRNDETQASIAINKKNAKALEELKAQTIKTAQSAASGQKTIAKATADATKIELNAYIKTAIANLIKNNAKHLAFIPPPANAVILAGLASAAGTALMQQVDKIGAQTGSEGVVDKPTQFTVGEGGAAEYVSVTPMEGVDNAGGGQGININITGNVMSQQFVEEELSERIAEAVRKGISFA